MEYHAQRPFFRLHDKGGQIDDLAAKLKAQRKRIGGPQVGSFAQLEREAGCRDVRCHGLVVAAVLEQAFDRNAGGYANRGAQLPFFGCRGDGGAKYYAIEQ